MKLRNILIAAAGLATLIGTASTASAETTWAREHPGRVEVVTRTRALRHTIYREHRTGQISAAQAHNRLTRVNHIWRQEQSFARHHHGHLNYVEQGRLNHEETRVREHNPG